MRQGTIRLLAAIELITLLGAAWRGGLGAGAGPAPLVPATAEPGASLIAGAAVEPNAGPALPPGAAIVPGQVVVRFRPRAGYQISAATEVKGMLARTGM